MDLFSFVFKFWWRYFQSQIKIHCGSEEIATQHKLTKKNSISHQQPHIWTRSVKQINILAHTQNAQPYTWIEFCWWHFAAFQICFLCPTALTYFSFLNNISLFYVYTTPPIGSDFLQIFWGYSLMSEYYYYYLTFDLFCGCVHQPTVSTVRTYRLYFAREFWVTDANNKLVTNLKFIFTLLLLYSNRSFAPLCLL